MALVLVLLLIVLLATMGLAFVTSRTLQRRTAVRSVQATQAQAIALAGLEDARIKLQKDLNFPPQGANSQTQFCYAEDLLDTRGNQVGHYRVTVDTAHRRPPYWVVRLTSVGYLGTRPEPIAQRTLQTELDVSPQDRKDPSRPNPRLFRYLRWVDQGSP